MGQKILLTVLRYTISTILLIFILSIFYRVAPKRPITFKQAIPGAVFGVIVWQLLSVGFGFYVSNFSNYNQTYGSLGSVVIVLLWLYFTGLIILLGSELNASWERFMKKADPKKMEEKTSERTSGSGFDSDQYVWLRDASTTAHKKSI